VSVCIVKIIQGTLKPPYATAMNKVFLLQKWQTWVIYCLYNDFRLVTCLSSEEISAECDIVYNEI
jgi:hypothetical protein